ncbi:response regulator [Dethiosulfatarculus sandiegensis]|uniref:Chemotaxis protein CheY n=1 Tax=Dethiosulfatarculus sandiegensis TaxID=1429043 RepID=A0A0D2GM56_9BACT|nr:response regulator [Dethiosulfatarculus sandiegensis]KIX15792.1 chemotaxis protein CheY [Dethiosulfatarculus sandiegensis]
MGRPNVLIVDDEQDFLSSLVQRFKLRGMDVSGAPHAEKALEIMESQEFDVVVLDIKMPGMGGMAALEKIKKLYPKTQVVVLTGHGCMESGAQGMALGAFDYMIKPVKINDLIQKIKHAYEEKK